MARPGHPHPPDSGQWFYRRNVDPRYPQARPHRRAMIASRLVGDLRTRVTLYTREHLELSYDQKYFVMCERHGLMVSTDDRAEAVGLYRGTPAEWCERCQANRYMLK